MNKSLTYADAGVDIEAGDQASHNAYGHAKATFPSRAGMIGAPVIQDGGFAGMIDMGEFYLTQCCDTVGTKIMIAENSAEFSGLGSDLLAMVADDAVCAGAEVVSMTNTFETNKIDAKAIDTMMASLSSICQAQKIVISGGEIAEVGAMTNGTGWGADAVGVIRKDRVITGSDIKSGHHIIGLKGRVLRCNGFSLARKISAENFGNDWANTEWKDGQTWGQILLTPSKVFHRTLLDAVLGDYAGDRKFPVHGVIHITGGGIPGNVPRIFPDDSLGAHFDDLHTPHPAVAELVRLGNVADREAYRTWNCGTAMMLVVDAENSAEICTALNKIDKEVEAKVVGTVNDSGTISLISGFGGDTIRY